MSSRRDRARCGFGLIELIVALAVLGVLLSAIIGLTSGFLGFSRRINVINERLVDINDAIGYVGLNVRRAMGVYGEDETSSVRFTGVGLAFDCHLNSADGACLALLVPVRDPDETWSILEYQLLAYRVVPLSAWTVGMGNPGLAEGWANSETPLMLEYRARLACGTPIPPNPNPCPPPSVPASIQAQQASLVIADLTFETAASVAFEPFEVGAAASRVTVRMRSLGSGQNAGIAVPGDEPLSTVFVRRP